MRSTASSFQALLLVAVLALAGCAAPEESGDAGDGNGGASPVTTTPATDPGAPGTGGTAPPADEPSTCEGDAECLLFLAEEPEWAVERKDCVKEFHCADEGKELVVLTLVLRNAGEEEIDTNPFSFHLYTPSTVLAPDVSTYGTSNPMDGGAKLRPGATTTGQLSFQVKKDEPAEKICWEGYSSRRFSELQFCHEFEDGALAAGANA